MASPSNDHDVIDEPVDVDDEVEEEGEEERTFQRRRALVPKLHDARFCKWMKRHHGDVSFACSCVEQFLESCTFPSHSARLDSVALHRNMSRFLYTTS
jgi:hypothetical protein